MNFCISNIILAFIEYLVNTRKLVNFFNFKYLSEYLINRFDLKEDKVEQMVDRLKALLSSDEFKKIFIV